MSTTPTGVRCNRCARDVALLDEHGRCERCVRDAESRAGMLDSHENKMTEMVEMGFTPDQLREELEMFLTDKQGLLPGDFIERDAEGWASVDSAFLAGDDMASPNRLRSWRERSGWTLEELADRLDVDPATVAVWEGGGDIPAHAVEVYTELTGSSADFLLGEEG